jgi:hypothetical protein
MSVDDNIVLTPEEKAELLSELPPESFVGEFGEYGWGAMPGEAIDVVEQAIKDALARNGRFLVSAEIKYSDFEGSSRTDGWLSLGEEEQ